MMKLVGRLQNGNYIALAQWGQMSRARTLLAVIQGISLHNQVRFFQTPISLVGVRGLFYCMTI